MPKRHSRAIILPTKPPETERPNERDKYVRIKSPEGDTYGIDYSNARQKSHAAPLFTHSHPVSSKWWVSDEVREPGKGSALNKLSEHSTENAAYEAAKLHAESIGSFHFHHATPILREA